MILNKKDIFTHLKNASTFCDTGKRGMPVLSCCRITLSEGTLTIKSTDLDTHFSSSLPIEDKTSSFDALVHCQTLLMLLKEMDESIHFNLKPKEHADPDLTISSPDKYLL